LYAIIYTHLILQLVYHFTVQIIFSIAMAEVLEFLEQFLPVVNTCNMCEIFSAYH